NDDFELDKEPPHLEVYPATTPNGSAILICPGGGYGHLAIDHEGKQIAEFFNANGFQAFVLHYRLNNQAQQGHKFPDQYNDVTTAMRIIRSRAGEWKIDPDRIGIIGFSAGGTVTAAAAFNYTADNKPNFDAPIYAYFPDSMITNIASDAPPMFIAAASDDGLGLAPHSVNLYQRWLAAKHSAELHMYATGNHGFGMRVQHLPSDTWIERFGDWLQQQGFAKGTASLNSSQIERMQMVYNDWPNLAKYKEENEKLAARKSTKSRVVFMGNSITEGWKNTDSAFFADEKNYIDRGFSGQTTPQMVLRFRQDVIDLKPTVVVILAGINDIAQNTGPMTL
ncbi:MAG TPA: alpha/beta hydrolase fold domain-containing protein, partial [Flavisolibacter sp.]|nr:alpha/beta hydrolase fold domain-containing protein [Flavisolibacter sp.]